MQVAKWGNSLAIRLPAAVVEALGLKEGDHIAVQVVGKHNFAISRDNQLEDAMKRLRARRIPFPPDWKFDRDEANAR